MSTPQICWQLDTQTALTGLLSKSEGLQLSWMWRSPAIDSLSLPKLFPLWIPLIAEELWYLASFAGTHHEMLHWVGQYYIKQKTCGDTSTNKMSKIYQQFFSVPKSKWQWWSLYYLTLFASKAMSPSGLPDGSGLWFARCINLNAALIPRLCFMRP